MTFRWEGGISKVVGNDGFHNTVPMVTVTSQFNINRSRRIAAKHMEDTQTHTRAPKVEYGMQSEKQIYT